MDMEQQNDPIYDPAAAAVSACKPVCAGTIGNDSSCICRASGSRTHQQSACEARRRISTAGGAAPCDRICGVWRSDFDGTGVLRDDAVCGGAHQSNSRKTVQHLLENHAFLRSHAGDTFCCDPVLEGGAPCLKQNLT